MDCERIGYYACFCNGGMYWHCALDGYDHIKFGRINGSDYIYKDTCRSGSGIRTIDFYNE